jgi:hypothetical protein
MATSPIPPLTPAQRRKGEKVSHAQFAKVWADLKPAQRQSSRAINEALRRAYGVTLDRTQIWRKTQALLGPVRSGAETKALQAVAESMRDMEIGELRGQIETCNQAQDTISRLLTRANALLERIEVVKPSDVLSMVATAGKLMEQDAIVREKMAAIKAKEAASEPSAAGAWPPQGDFNIDLKTLVQVYPEV